MTRATSTTTSDGGTGPRSDIALTPGERYPVGERNFTLTPRLAEALARTRPVLVDVAAHHEVITYGELSEAIDGLVAPRHMGPLLHMVGHDCRMRDEPSLAALVVGAASGEVGTADDFWAPPERRACWRRWASAEGLSDTDRHAI